MDLMDVSSDLSGISFGSCNPDMMMGNDVFLDRLLGQFDVSQESVTPTLGIFPEDGNYPQVSAAVSSQDGVGIHSQDPFNESLDIPDHLFDKWCEVPDSFAEDMPEGIEEVMQLVERMHEPHVLQQNHQRAEFIVANRGRAEWVIRLVTEFVCSECDELLFQTAEEAHQHALTSHQAEIIQQGYGADDDTLPQDSVELVLHKQALDGVVNSFRANLDNHHFVTSLALFQAASDSIRENLTLLLEQLKGLKVSFQLHVNFLKPGDMSSIISKWLNTHKIILVSPTNIDALVHLAILKIEKQIENFQEQGSGLLIANISELHMDATVFEPYRMGTYRELPAPLRRKRMTFVNVDNSVATLKQSGVSVDAIELEKKMCFVWSVLAGLHPDSNVTRNRQVDSYRKFLKELNVDGLEWPMTLEQISKFERQNPTIAVSVFFYDEDIGRNATEEDHSDETDIDRRGTKRVRDDFPVLSNSERKKLEKFVKLWMRGPEDQDRPVTDDELQQADERKTANVVEKRVYPVYVSEKRPGVCSETCSKKCLKHQYKSRCGKRCEPVCPTHRPVTHIDLLLLESPHQRKSEQRVGHFVLIKDFSNLFTSRGNARAYYCRFCLQSFKSERTLGDHVESCSLYGPQKTKFSKDWKLHFENYSGMNHAPHVIYADFEAFLKPIKSEEVVTYRKIGNKYQYIFKKDHPKGNTNFKQEHRMCGYAYAHVNYEGDLVQTKVYHATDDNEDVVVKFLNDVIELSGQCFEDIAKRQKTAPELRLGPEPTNKDCYFCGMRIPTGPNNIMQPELERWFDKLYLHVDYKKYSKLSQDDRIDKVWQHMLPVVHHCHYSHQVLGNAHSYCNIKNRSTRDVTVVIHNLSNYDGHPILQALGEVTLENDPSFIPLSSERFISLELKYKPGKIRFIDSCRFLSCSLASLTQQLATEGARKFGITNSMCQLWEKGTERELALLLRKGVFPYSFLQDTTAFAATELPEKEYFTSDLTKEKITDEDYEHAQKVWDAFGCESFGDYHDLYCLLDVCLLADIFENFRGLFEDSFGLDPVNYVSLPSISWQAALKHTKIELDYITDPDVFLFYERAIIGGLACGGSVKYAKANNEYVEGYNPDEQKVFIQYLDATNLYGTCLSKALPTGGFVWVERNWTSEAVLALKDDGPLGFTFEVDLMVPDQLKDYFDDYPLAPVSRVVSMAELSKHQLETMEKLGMKESDLTTKKLVADLHPKFKYILDYRTLQLYIKLGMQVTKFHRVIQYSQSVWLEPYITWCTQKRQSAKSDFEKDFFKLQINSIYGKTVENTRKRSRISVWMDSRKAKLCARQASLKDVIPISKNMVLAVHRKPSITLDRPIYVGVTCLSLAKFWMYDFYYNYVKKHFPNSSNLIFTDTDSLCIKFSEDPYQKMKENSNMFDMSDFSPTDANFGHLYDPQNKKKRGTFKDECANLGPIKEFLFLKPKMYSYTTETGYHGMRAKGVPKVYLKKSHKHGDYVNVFLNNGQTHIKGTRIAAYRHKLFTIDYMKKALNTFDSKRYMVDHDRSLAFGNPKIPNTNTN